MEKCEGSSLAVRLTTMIERSRVEKGIEKNAVYRLSSEKAEKIITMIEEAWVLINNHGRDRVDKKLVRGIEKLNIPGYDDIRALKPETLAVEFYNAAVQENKDEKSASRSDGLLVKKSAFSL